MGERILACGLHRGMVGVRVGCLELLMECSGIA